MVVSIDRLCMITSSMWKKNSKPAFEPTRGDSGVCIGSWDDGVPGGVSMPVWCGALQRFREPCTWTWLDLSRHSIDILVGRGMGLTQPLGWHICPCKYKEIGMFVSSLACWCDCNLCCKWLYSMEYPIRTLGYPMSARSWFYRISSPQHFTEALRPRVEWPNLSQLIEIRKDFQRTCVMEWQ